MRFSLTASWDAKFVGKDCRLQWNRDGWMLEELPQKGKKKLRVCHMQNPYGIASQQRALNADAMIPENILMAAKLSKSDDFDSIKKSIFDAMEAAAAKSPVDWVRKAIAWRQDEVYFLEVVPENVHPFEVEGKDFTLAVTWTGFNAYSPSSDLQQADPHYTAYAEKSPAAARKLYVTLKTDPSALKSTPFKELGAWLDLKKIPYKTNFSSWG